MISSYKTNKKLYEKIMGSNRQRGYKVCGLKMDKNKIIIFKSSFFFMGSFLRLDVLKSRLQVF